MTTKELYYEFSLLYNKNSERANINIEIYNFIYLFNREAKRWLHDMIKLRNNSDSILYLSSLLVKNKQLKRIESKDTYYKYERPENLFMLIHGDCYSKVSNGTCAGIVYNYFKKPNDVSISIDDKFTRPSLEWERGLAEQVSDGIVIYKEGFEIDATFISYYRMVTEIDEEGYVKIDGSNSVTIDPVEEDFLLSAIIDRVVVEVHREFENSNGFQLGKTREQQ